MSSENLCEALISFLKESSVNTVIINNKSFFDREEAIASIASSIEGTIKTGDINECMAVLDIENLKRYTKANKACLSLFTKPLKFEFECYKNLSFASSTITCENFGFDIEKYEHKDKQRFQEFIELIDFLEISSGVGPTEIIVNFTVNNVWRERR